MPVKKATVKKAAPRKTAAKSTDTAPEVANDATWLALQWLLPKAFPNAQWPHAAQAVDDSGLPDEVKSVLHEAYARASA